LYPEAERTCGRKICFLQWCTHTDYHVLQYTPLALTLCEISVEKTFSFSSQLNTLIQKIHCLTLWGLRCFQKKKKNRSCVIADHTGLKCFQKISPADKSFTKSLITLRKMLFHANFKTLKGAVFNFDS